MYGHRFPHFQTPHFPAHYGLPFPQMQAAAGLQEIIGYQEIIGSALDELDSQDMGHTAGGAYPALGAYPAVGLRELVGAGDPFAQLYAAAGAGDPNALQALATQMQQARAIDPNAVVVRERAEDTRRVYHMGFDSGVDTAAGLAGTATQQPQVTIRPERLVVPSFLAPFFTVDNIIVGKDSQSAVGANPVPASTYSEVAVGVRLNLKTANLGHLVTLAFTNVDTDPHRFRATMIGTATDVG
jgi:hypothetical protein